MTADEAVLRIDSLTGSDPEMDHGDVDRILLDLAPVEVREAYDRLVSRAKWWAYA